MSKYSLRQVIGAGRRVDKFCIASITTQEIH